MKKIISIIAIVFLFSGIAFGASPIEKSQIFMKAGDFYQAKRVLEAEYRENPSAKILYLLGTAHLMSGNYRSAMRKYEKSVRLDPSYKNKIARILADQGSALVTEYKFDDARKCFIKAAEYCSDYRQTVPAALIKKGKDILLNKKDIYTSFLYFNLAKDINPQFNENIAIYFWTASKALQSNNEGGLRAKSSIYSYIPLFSRKYDKKMGMEFARMAKLNSIPNQLKKSFKKSAKTLLSKADFEKIFSPPPLPGNKSAKQRHLLGKGLVLMTMKASMLKFSRAELTPKLDIKLYSLVKMWKYGGMESGIKPLGEIFIYYKENRRWRLYWSKSTKRRVFLYDS